jgi:hypothetical protein
MQLSYLDNKYVESLNKEENKCRWKSLDEDEPIYFVSCINANHCFGDSYFFKDQVKSGEFKFCSYCGKEIEKYENGIFEK